MKILPIFVAAMFLCPALAFGQSQTEQEVIDVLMSDETDIYSKHGALEFWSSGGLLNEVPPRGRQADTDSVNLQIKHIRVLTLIEDQAAVAHYYSEGFLAPKGYPPVYNYLARVTQVFVKEDGKWKVRSSHWSPVVGGSGTTQTALVE